MQFKDSDSFAISNALVLELKRLTMDDKLVWSRDENGKYYSHYKSIKSTMEFYSFQRKDEEPSDNCMVELFINNLGYDFAIGTKPYCHLIDIIAYSFWANHSEDAIKSNSTNIQTKELLFTLKRL
jgi:hypothetical protein